MGPAREAIQIDGLMQDWPLTVDRFLDHAARSHGSREVVGRENGALVRTDYATIHGDAKRLTAALIAAGIVQGDRIATLGMNGVGHLACWYGIAGMGAICHTLNPRLFVDQLGYIVNHAQDRIIFADGAMRDLLEKLLPTCPSVEQVIFLTGTDGTSSLPVPHSSLAEFLDHHDGSVPWGNFDERSAAGLCYTSGTTGDPKGVLYSHRSNFLHALTTIQRDVFDLGSDDVVMMVVPMYHANGWALTFSAPAVGAKLVLPGAALDGASLLDLIEREGVTFTAGVPTVWLSLLDEIETRGQAPSTLRRVIVGGAACPEQLLRRFHAAGIDAVTAWGMTEMSPIGTIGALPPQIAELPFEQQLPWRLKQGRAPLGVELKLVDDQGGEVACDGVQTGRLLVRGPAVASRYYRAEQAAVDEDGYLDTGDIASIDAFGSMRITDRAKDLIKSGGEWISATEVEAAALSHQDIVLAAVIAVAHPRWGERPRLYVQPTPGVEIDLSQLRALLATKLADWWLPDEIVTVDEMPLGATGKVDKKVLRRALAEGSPADGLV